MGEGNEKEAMLKDPADFYLPIWTEVNQLKELLVYPLEIRDWLLEDIKNNFKNTPRDAQMTVEELRHSL